MALDEEDLKQIGKMFNTAFSERMERAEKKQADAQAKAIADAMSEAFTAHEAKTAAKAADAAKPNPEVEERKTLTQRIKDMEAERKADKDALKAEKAKAAFHKAWTGAKFVPELADEHMAFLRGDGRILHDEDGTIRVKDPAKHASETQPKLDEYMGELAKSDRGKLYTPAPKTAGGGATAPTNGVPMNKREVPAGTLDGVFGGETRQ